MSARFHPVERSEGAEVGTAEPNSVRKTEAFAAGNSAVRPRARFGILVAKRHAQRAVVRNAVRRVLREAARHRAASLDRAASGKSLEVLLRLKGPLPDADAMGWRAVKHAIRHETDGLFARLERAVRGNFGRAAAKGGA